MFSSEEKAQLQGATVVMANAMNNQQQQPTYSHDRQQQKHSEETRNLVSLCFWISTQALLMMMPELLAVSHCHNKCHKKVPKAT